jgi:hypothetical protein
MEYEEVWGISIPDLVSRDWRHQSQYSQHRQPQSRPEPRHSATSPIAISRTSHHRDSAESATSFRSSSPSPLPSLGRSLDELRLHNRPPHADSRSSGTTHDHHRERELRIISDADIDPALQGGSASQRSHSAGEAPQSLPSLKASGLLDSWNPGKDSSMAGPWSANAYVQQSPLRRQSPARRGTPPSAGSHYTHYDTDSSRAAANGMPVGMPWLANESR